MHPEDLVITVLSLCIFPYLAKPLLQPMLGLEESSYDTYLNSRKASITATVFASFTP